MSSNTMVQMSLCPRSIAVCLCLVLAACASNTPRTSIPGEGEQTGSYGGAPWLLPPGSPSNTELATLPPEEAIPMQGLAGTWNGEKLGQDLTQETRDHMIALTQSALNQGVAGKKIKWRRGNLSGTIVPQVAFAGPEALECREFHQTLRQGETIETGYATACLAPDGQWRLLTE